MAGKKRIEVDIIANDESSRVFDRVASGSLTMAQRFNNAMTSMSQNLHRYNSAMSTFNRYTQLALVGAGYMTYKFTKSSIQNFNEFERQHAKTMGAIASNYDKTAAAQKRFINESQKLKEQAIRLGTFGVDGRGSLYNPQQVSYAQTTMVKAGRTATQLVNSNVIPQIIQFAGGNDLGIEQAAEYAVNIAEMFNIPTDKMGNMMDKITRAADISTIDVPDIFESIKYAGGIATAMKRPLEDVLAVIALMGNVGLRGSMSGTGLQSFLTRILDPVGVNEKALEKAPSQFAADTLQAFVSSATTPDGKFKPLSEVTGNLDDIYSKLTDKEQAWFSHKLFGLFQMKAGFAMAKTGGDTLQDVITDLNKNAPGTNQRKWDLMLNSSWGKWNALGNAWTGIQTDVGYRLSPLTNAIADELFRALSNKGNYKIDFTKIQKAINESGDLIAEQYGKELGGIVKRMASGGVSLARSTAANAPLMQGMVGGFAKLLGGDLNGALESFSSGLRESNDNIDKLPPELQGMAKEVRNATIVLTAISSINFAAKIADSISTIWRYSIGKLVSKNMSVAAGTVLINTGLVNKDGQPIYKQGEAPKGTTGGGNKTGGQTIIGTDGKPVKGSAEPGSTILGTDGKPLAPSTGTPKSTWKSKVGKGAGIASWIYAIGEMTGLNDTALDKSGVKGTPRDIIDSGRNILNWGLTAKLIDSLLLRGKGTLAAKGLLSGIGGIGGLFTAAGGGILGGLGLGGAMAAPLAMVAGGVYRENQRANRTNELIQQAKDQGKRWYWDDRTLANESGPLAKLKSLFTGYSDSILIVDTPEQIAARNAALLQQNKYKYRAGETLSYSEAPPSKSWYDYLNPWSDYGSRYSAWESRQNEARDRDAMERKYFDDAQKLALRGGGQPLAWADYAAKMDEWKRKVDEDRKSTNATIQQLPSWVNNALFSPFSSLIDTIRSMPVPQVNVPTVNVNVTVDQNGNILKQSSVIGDMNDLNNPFKIFQSRIGK